MEKKTARLEAFSDGIFGVAITLLAIEIGIKAYDGANNQNLWENIKEKWPEYFTFFNSFATVLLIWMGHHRIIDRVRVANHWIQLLNGLVLLAVVLFPFPTRMVGTFLDSPARNTAVAFYTAFTGLISTTMLLLNLSLAVNKKMLVSPEVDSAWLKTQIWLQAAGIFLYAIATIVAIYISSYIALGITFFMWIFWAIIVKDPKEEVE